MMYLIFTVIFAHSALAETTPILTLDQYSGRTSPQNAVEAHCTFDSNNHLIAKILKDHTNDTWQSETNIDEVKTDAELNQVLAWIEEAAVGPFKQGINPCDVGTVKISTQNYPLFFSQDCKKRIENQNPSAIKLINWFRQACSIEAKKQ